MCERLGKRRQKVSIKGRQWGHDLRHPTALFDTPICWMLYGCLAMLYRCLANTVDPRLTKVPRPRGWNRGGVQ
jgi:hypothetical protein